MQTIDTIRRTNELSKVLKQHGFTEDSLDAVEQANHATGGESEVLATDFASPQDPSPVLQKMANLERSKHMLSSRLDAMQQAQDATQSQLRQVLSRLDGAEAKLRTLRNQPAQAEASAVAPQEQPTALPPAPAASVAQPVAEQERHPRQAQVDEAYSIENVFYCGTK